MARKKRKSSKKGRKLKKRSYSVKLKQGTGKFILGILVMLFAVALAASLTQPGGFLGGLNRMLLRGMSWTAWFAPILVFLVGLTIMGVRKQFNRAHVLLGGILTMVSMAGVTNAGILGEEVYIASSRWLTKLGAKVFLAGSVLIGLIVLFNIAPEQLRLWIMKFLAGLRKFLEPLVNQAAPAMQATKNNGTSFLERTAEMSTSAVPKDAGVKSGANKDVLKVIGTTADAQQQSKARSTQIVPSTSSGVIAHPPPPTIEWKYPPLSLLSDVVDGEAKRGNVRQNAQIIEDTLESFGVDATVEDVKYGPAVTQYQIKVSLGTKLSKITGLGSDLALRLAAPTGQIRIEAPIPGTSLVGIEVPNHAPEVVGLRKILEHDQMQSDENLLSVALGRTVSGGPKVMNISKMPHLLIAGATGSGKSVCINTVICSLLFRASPDEVKMIMVDPKRVELTQYNGIPHLLTPVIVDVDKVPSALSWCVSQMQERYRQFAEVGARNIESYNKILGYQALPYIVVVIDELADIMMTSPRQVEELICRIAQMARATGIHLIIATQRPSVDVITGLIKANIPARIAFAVSSMVDSKVIIDGSGAEKLLGRGDMLFIPPDQAKAERIQGTWVHDSEIHRLLAFIKGQGVEPEYTEEVTTTQVGNDGLTSGNGGSDEDTDNLFNEAMRVIVNEDKASASLLQRKLSIGYARAARILDQLEHAGVVGPAQGSKPRDIYVDAITQMMGGGEG